MSANIRGDVTTTNIKYMKLIASKQKTANDPKSFACLPTSEISGEIRSIITSTAVFKASADNKSKKSIKAIKADETEAPMIQKMPRVQIKP